MVILRKKRILLILSCFMLSIFTFYISQNQKIKTPKTVETVALPVTNKVVVIDARSWNTRWWCFK